MVIAARASDYGVFGIAGRAAHDPRHRDGKKDAGARRARPRNIARGRPSNLLREPTKADMNATCIVSANAGRARIFLQARPVDPLEEINDMVNVSARNREAELETDALGQRAASNSRHSVGQPTQPSGYQPNQTPAQHEAERFARDVAGFLLQAHQEGRFGKLCLVASPEFLGVLRRMVQPKLGSAVALEIDKDYTHDTPDELRERIRARLRKH